MGSMIPDVGLREYARDILIGNGDGRLDDVLGKLDGETAEEGEPKHTHGLDGVDAPDPFNQNDGVEVDISRDSMGSGIAYAKGEVDEMPEDFDFTIRVGSWVQLSGLL